MRDIETAQIGIQASLTGHLVLSTLHTNSAIAAITRLRDMGIESFLLASSLRTIISQRLVRRLCLNCSFEEEPTKDFNSIISLCDTLYTWGIERFRVFSHLSASISAQSEFAQHFFYSAHFEIEAKF